MNYPKQAGVLSEDLHDTDSASAEMVVRNRSNTRTVLLLLALETCLVSVDAEAKKPPKESAASCEFYQGPENDAGWILLKGQCGKDGLIYGYAEARRKDGATYIGNWVKGKRQGQGICTYADGNRYEGQWKDGNFDGQGTYTFANGERYEGEWKDGKRNGKGTFTWADGGKYEGQWKDDTFNGQGTRTWADGNRYEGQWKDGNFDGQGTYTWANGERHEGEWKDDKLSGKGTRTYANGGKYEGEWKDGKRNGQGIYTWSNGNKYDGQWKDDKQDGKGIEFDANGMVFTGEWRDGKRMDSFGTSNYLDGWSFSHPKYKTPNAMYVYAGQLEAKSGETVWAKVVYKHIIANFPDSPIAVQATDRMRQMNEREEADIARMVERLRGNLEAEQAQEDRAAAKRDAIRQCIHQCENTYQSEFDKCLYVPLEKVGLLSDSRSFCQYRVQKNANACYDRCRNE